MKILYIIGNGFDLNLGLKTSYKDFYKYYRSLDSPKDSISNLKDSISSDYTSWSDLELALGTYTEKLKSIDEFDEVFEDIGEQLSKYLEKEEAKFDITKVNKEGFYANLVSPEGFLSEIDNTKIVNYKNNFKNTAFVVDIVTFNYTTLIEKIIEKKRNIEIGVHQSSPNTISSVILRSVEHIHGHADNRMVLGVNDISQLKNKEFHIKVDVLEAIIKDDCNKAYGHNVANFFKTKIEEADLITIFGASIGDTDNIWWKQIGDRLKVEHIPIIIFTKGDEVISPRIGYKANRIKRQFKDYFLNKTKLSEEEIDKVSQNIFIALNTPMFKEILKS